MDGQYPPPIPPMGAFYPTVPPSLYPSQTFAPRLHQLPTLSMESIGSYSDYEEANRAMLTPGPGQGRQRRRQPQGAEHVKHRRTRSGCYTCRQRRVKCDETQPVCDRCRKGKRECVYPGTTYSTKPSRSNGGEAKGSSDGGSSPSGDEYDDEKTSLSAIPDHDENEEGVEPQSAVSDSQRPSNVSFTNGNHFSPVAEGQSNQPRATTKSHPMRASTKHAAKPSISQSSRWSTLPKDVKAYLKYHKESLSYHHYGFKYDAGDFLKTTFLEIAMNDESAALLYAVVAFSAYHHAISHDNDQISTFLSYYNTSITQLQQSLKRKRHNVATLLTMLQLATIEEFLGDWKILLGHQRAAQQILNDLFTPQTIMQDETRRRILSWYIRFDLFAATMAGGQTMLDREWYASQADFYARQAQARPTDLGARFEDFFASSRLLATDVTLLIAAKTRGVMLEEQFAINADLLVGEVDRFCGMLETVFRASANFVKSLPNAPPPSPADITDFYDPEFLYGGDYFTMNYVLIDSWAIQLNFKYQLAMIQGQPLSAELTQLALKKAKMFEAIQYCDQILPGGVLGCQASHGLASLFLPRDKRHTDWARRKFALIEQNGYIYPAKLREYMSQQWNEDVTHWWLPNAEGSPRAVHAVREFIEYRASMQTDELGAHLRDMSGVLGAMSVSDIMAIPDDLAGTGTDSDVLDPTLERSMGWESSPEQPWT